MVAEGAEAGNASDANGSDDRRVTELFTRVYVRHMDFNRWNAYRRNGVADSVRIVSEGTRVENDAVEGVNGAVNIVNDISLVV